ncbi:MAG: hypothetical protein FJ014_13660 [Chloroflexi bacterium]|nr:hypothetical protein [Chloroflexota bacterium]
MAKKSRRTKKRVGKKRSVSAVRQRRPVSAPGPTVAKETQALAEEKVAQLAEEYRYVYSDLKRIAILAGTMLTVLIILSLVIG